MSLLVLQASAAETSSGSMVYDGRERTYKVHLPPDQGDPAGRLPLVLVLHGFDGDADEAESMSGMSEKADLENFIAVYPEGTGNWYGRARAWNAENCCAEASADGVDDIGFIKALIEKLSGEYPVDPDRVYVTGFSNGAMMAYRLACMLSDKIAAIAPISGSLDDKNCRPSRPVSVIAVHGTADQKILYEGGVSSVYGVQKNYDPPVSFAVEFWASHDGAEPIYERVPDAKNIIVRKRYLNPATGAEVSLITLVGGMHAWPDRASGLNATDEIWDFFKRHKRI